MKKSEFMKLLGDRFEFVDENGDYKHFKEDGHMDCLDGLVWFKEKDVQSPPNTSKKGILNLKADNIFPKVFETRFHEFRIYEDGDVIIKEKTSDDDRIFLTKEEAVEFAKKIQGGK